MKRSEVQAEPAPTVLDRELEDARAFALRHPAKWWSLDSMSTNVPEWVIPCVAFLAVSLFFGAFISVAIYVPTVVCEPCKCEPIVIGAEP